MLPQLPMLQGVKIFLTCQKKIVFGVWSSLKNKELPEDMCPPCQPVGGVNP
jgi:hypothetical protein